MPVQVELERDGEKLVLGPFDHIRIEAGEIIDERGVILAALRKCDIGSAWLAESRMWDLIVVVAHAEPSEIDKIRWQAADLYRSFSQRLDDLERAAQDGR